MDGTRLRSHSGSPTCALDLGACLTLRHTSLPRSTQALAALVLQGSRLPQGLALLWRCPLTLLPPVSPGVPRTTTQTTARRCCRSGWPLWGMTMPLWSGGPRGTPGGDGGRVLGKRAATTTQRGKETARQPDSRKPPPPGQGSMNCPATQGTACTWQIFHLFTLSGPTQTKRVPSTGPKKGTSF